MMCVVVIGLRFCWCWCRGVASVTFLFLQFYLFFLCVKLCLMGCEMIGYNKEVIYDIRADDNKIARKPHKM